MLRLLAALALIWLTVPAVAARPVVIVALGDSLTAGLGLDVADAFPARLEAALREEGHEVQVVNAGISGDTAADGLARFDWALTAETDALIVEFGANDALRGLPPSQAEAALDALLTKAGERKLPVLLAGMRAPPNLGPDYGREFEAIFPRLAARHGALLYSFFLDGVAADPELNQGDGMHPNRRGVDVIVARIRPSVEKLLDRVPEK